MQRVCHFSCAFKYDSVPPATLARFFAWETYYRWEANLVPMKQQVFSTGALTHWHLVCYTNTWLKEKEHVPCRDLLPPKQQGCYQWNSEFSPLVLWFLTAVDQWQTPLSCRIACATVVIIMKYHLSFVKSTQLGPSNATAIMRWRACVSCVSECCARQGYVGWVCIRRTHVVSSFFSSQ